MSEKSAEGTVLSSSPESLLIEYEESLLEASELIETILTENLVENEYNVRRTTVILGLEQALKSEIDSDDTHELSHALLAFIGRSNPDLLDEMKEEGAGSEFLKFLARLSSKFAVESTIPNLVEYQGKNFWRDIYVEIVKRPYVDAVGMNYHIESSGGEEVELSTDVQSNLTLIANLLQAQNDAMSEFPEEAEQQTNPELIENVKDELEELEENMKMTEYSDNSESDDE